MSSENLSPAERLMWSYRFENSEVIGQVEIRNRVMDAARSLAEKLPGEEKRMFKIDDWQSISFQSDLGAYTVSRKVYPPGDRDNSEDRWTFDASTRLPLLESRDHGELPEGIGHGRYIDYDLTSRRWERTEAVLGILATHLERQTATATT